MVEEPHETTNTSKRAAVIEEDLEQLALRHLTPKFLERALNAVYSGYQAAYDECRAGYADTEHENLWPFARRAKIEGYLRDAADLTSGLTGTAVKPKGQNWWHTEIRGGPIVITESAVASPGAMVKEADFRYELAQTNHPTLWAADDDDTETPIYGVLIHSRSHWDDPKERAKAAHLPGSCNLAFPDVDLEGYLCRIDLFERFPKIVEQHWPNDLDQVALVRYIDRSRQYRAFGG